MCGIAGLLGRSPKDFAERVGPHLSHRGPDDSGSWVDDTTCLVHRRLAIIDLSSTGHQPMVSSCGRWHLVFNGEIYNHNYLREELMSKGHKFNGSSDTEVLLKWMVYRGRSGLYSIRGMYAFCLYDSFARRALLARDPHGIKPIYYWQGANGELIFSSELRALLACGLVSQKLNHRAIAGYLSRGSVFEPETIVEGVNRLPAGHYANWEQGGLDIVSWCPIPESINYTGRIHSKKQAIELTRSALEDSVSSHLVSDVQVGLFLSAGLDSASILALAPRGLHTFTIGFGESAYDESEPAARIARQFGAVHTPLTITAKQAEEWLPNFLTKQDQPSIDGYNTWCVSKLASDQGLKVALSGLGGDELFGGYRSFQTVPILNHWRRRLGSAGHLSSKALLRTPGSSNHKLQRLCTLLEAAPSIRESYNCFRGIFSQHEVNQLMEGWGIKQTDFDVSPRITSFNNSSIGELDEVALLEGTSYLRNQLLPDSDVMSMANGLELRLPFVDSVLQRQLASIPSTIRLAPGKQMLRQAIPELPDWFIKRPKQGFSFPFQQWLDNPTNPLQIQLPTTPSGIDLRPWYRRWSLMVLDQWLKDHLAIELPT